MAAMIEILIRLLTTLLFLVLDFHHLLLRGMVTSYEMFPAGDLPSMGDFSELTTRAASDAFTMGVQLASPHMAYGLIFYLAGGLMGRLMPQFQVFFVMMSAQIMIAFFLLIAILSTLIYVYMDHVNESLQSIFVN
jgi:flagellar biosynthetic protein FliR